jgi:four helix bundle protein
MMQVAKWRSGEVAKAAEKPKVTHFKDLLVWQKGMELAERVYRLTTKFPGDERFGLVSQMRRAAVSVPSNISEGQARQSTKEFLQFISHAMGSLAELETQVILAERLNHCGGGDTLEIQRLIADLDRMLRALRRSLAKESV